VRTSSSSFICPWRPQTFYRRRTRRMMRLKNRCRAWLDAARLKHKYSGWREQFLPQAQAGIMEIGSWRGLWKAGVQQAVGWEILCWLMHSEKCALLFPSSSQALPCPPQFAPPFVSASTLVRDPTPLRCDWPANLVSGVNYIHADGLSDHLNEHFRTNYKRIKHEKGVKRKRFLTHMLGRKTAPST